MACQALFLAKCHEISTNSIKNFENSKNNCNFAAFLYQRHASKTNSPQKLIHLTPKVQFL